MVFEIFKIYFFGKVIIACIENGVANITIIDGWFVDSCEVECK
jgi:hypothetical protein